MPDRTVHYTTHPAVAYTRLDECEAVLLHLESQHYFSLNETGVAIWDLLSEPRSLAEIVEALAETYEADRETMAALVARFVGDLRRDGLVREVSAAG